LDSFCCFVFRRSNNRKKYKAAFTFARQTALRGVTAAVVGLLLAAFYDPVWTAEILTKLDYALAAAALSAM
jgi:hypothetical protein